jgi:hypothetical protein
MFFCNHRGLGGPARAEGQMVLGGPQGICLTLPSSLRTTRRSLNHECIVFVSRDGSIALLGFQSYAWEWCFKKKFLWVEVGCELNLFLELTIIFCPQFLLYLIVYLTARSRNIFVSI